MGLDPIGGPKEGQAGRRLRAIEPEPLPTTPRDKGSRRGVMAGYELVGLALLALFFGSLVSSKQSLSR